MPQYSLWKDQGDTTGRTYGLSTTVCVTGVGTLKFNADVSQEEIDRIVYAFRNALGTEAEGFYPVVNIHKDDILHTFEANDYGFVTDEMASEVADEIGDNDAFMEQYWLTLRTIVEEYDAFAYVREAIEQSKLWYEYELKLGMHVVAKCDITGLMLRDLEGTTNKRLDDIVVPEGTEGVIVGIDNFEEDGVAVEWYLFETFKEEDDGDVWNVNPEWLEGND
jgi:hypothetical protein